MIDWLPFTDIVRQNRRFLLTSHMRPDCDALGSELAMAGVLRQLGKRVRIVNGQAAPPHLGFIDPEHQIEVIGEQVSASEVEDVDVFMVLDTSAWVQLGPMAALLHDTRAMRVVIDHHVGEDDLQAVVFKDVQAEATGTLVIEAADQLNVALTPDIATAAFAAVATDTGWFRFNSVRSSTYRLAARLVEAGAKPDLLFRQLYEQDSLARFRLRGLVCERVTVELSGRLIYTHVLRDDFRQTGAQPSDTEDIVNMTLSVAGTEVAVIFVEQPSGAFKVSFRSRTSVDCSAVAAEFGGGGHRAAAGAMIQGSLKEVQTRVLDAVRTAMG